MKFLRKFLEILRVWVVAAGTIGFCLFILEEASQIATFSTFMSKTNQDYELVLAAADAMEVNNQIILTINKYIGWINPFSYIAFGKYAVAQKIYADACILFVLRNQPELLNNREIEIEFTPKEIVNLANRYMYRNGKIAVVSENLMPLESMKIKGRVENGKISYIEKASK